MRFTLSIENFVQQNCLLIFILLLLLELDFLIPQNNGISNWNLANAFESYSTILLLVNFNSVSETEHLWLMLFHLLHGVALLKLILVEALL